MKKNYVRPEIKINTRILSRENLASQSLNDWLGQYGVTESNLTSYEIESYSMSSSQN